MKKQKTSLALAALMVLPTVAQPIFSTQVQAYGAPTVASEMAQIRPLSKNNLSANEAKTYDVTYRLVKEGNENEKSMANQAIIPQGKVVEENGKFTYTIKTQPMMNGAGVILELFYTVNGEEKKATPVSEGVWSITLDQKADRIALGFNVKIMDVPGKKNAVLKVAWPTEGATDEGDKTPEMNEKITYQVPVKLTKEDGTPFMEGDILDPTATVDVDGEDYTYTLQFKYFETDDEEGYLKNLFYYDDAGAQKQANSYGAHRWSFATKGKVERQKVHVWVDIDGQTKERDAYLTFDFSGVNDNNGEKKPGGEEQKPDDSGKTPEKPKDGNETKPEDGNKEKPKEENPQDKKDTQIQRHEIPVELVKVDGGKSMASSAVDSKATVEVDQGHYTYYVQFNPIKFNQLEGHLTNLFYYDGAEKRQATDHGNGRWSFTLNEKVESQKIAIWVDIMDQIAGGSGKGEQDACLKFDFSGIDKNKPERGDKKPGSEGQKPDEGGKTPEKPKDGNETKPKDENKDKPKEDKKDDKKDEKKKKQTVRYDVPLELVKSDGSKSMASSALSSWATVDEYDGHYTYYIQFKPMKFNDKEGRLTNLFYYENGRKHRARYHGGDLWSFTLDERVSSQKIAVWVDIMDELAGGAGKGEQEAYIQFNWYRAKETKRFDGEVKEPEKKKEDEKKEEEKKKVDEKTLEEKKKEFLKAQRERERQVVLRTFGDVTADHWALDAIAHSYARGYFKGAGEGRFAPERAITRGEFVTILGRKAGASASNTATIFQDVSSGAYYASYVAWAQSQGIVAGVGQGRFEPNRTITREEMAVMLNKFLASQNKSYAATGYGNFSDGGSIAVWAKNSVDKMTRQGLLSGMGNGNFAPKESFSRAQAAQVLYTIDTKDMK